MPIHSPMPNDKNDVLVGDQEFMDEVKTGIHPPHKTLGSSQSTSAPQTSTSQNHKLSPDPDIEIVDPCPAFGLMLKHTSAEPSVAAATSQKTVASKGKGDKASECMSLYIIYQNHPHVCTYSLPINYNQCSLLCEEWFGWQEE
jgi:hypothetical protein